MIIGASFIFIVTIARNIQIKVYFLRDDSYSTCLAFVNLIAAAFNIAAYIGFIILAIFKTEGEGVDQRERDSHFIASLVYYACSSIYGVIHTILLWRQSQYPLWLKVLFTVITVATVTVSIVYGASVFAESSDIYELQWIGVISTSVYVIMFAILFHIDPVEDELAAFFCCNFQ